MPFAIVGRALKNLNVRKVSIIIVKTSFSLNRSTANNTCFIVFCGYVEARKCDKVLFRITFKSLCDRYVSTFDDLGAARNPSGAKTTTK